MRPHRTKAGMMTQVRREFGLGSYPTVGMAEARTAAMDLIAKISQGIDPKQQRKTAALAAIAEMANQRTFAECEKDALDAKAAGYKNQGKSIKGWRTRMDLYAIPVIGNRNIAELTEEDIAGVLKPIWRTKHPTAKKLLHDIAGVFRYAKVRKLFRGDNPAQSETLELLLGKPTHSKKHFPSLPYQRMAEFMVTLRSLELEAAHALEFLILTAARSDEVRSAPWSEFDLKKKLWTIPAARMKRPRDHCVPLSDDAIAVLRRQQAKGGKYPFANKSGKPLSDMALSSLVKRMHETSLGNEGAGFMDPIYNKIAVPHGFRSSFKDWARNLTQYADEVSELALAHVNSDSTRAAYARDALLDPRRQLMQDWAEFCK